MTDNIDVLVSRHRELRGKHVVKVPREILDKEAAWKELVDDYSIMCKSGENKNHCERVYRASRRLAKSIAEWYDNEGLDLPEYLTRPREAKEAGAARYEVPRDIAPALGKRLSTNTRTGKPRN